MNKVYHLNLLLQRYFLGNKLWIWLCVIENMIYVWYFSHDYGSDLLQWLLKTERQYWTKLNLLLIFIECSKHEAHIKCYFLRQIRHLPDVCTLLSRWSFKHRASFSRRYGVNFKFAARVSHSTMYEGPASLRDSHPVARIPYEPSLSARTQGKPITC